LNLNIKALLHYWNFLQFNEFINKNIAKIPIAHFNWNKFDILNKIAWTMNWKKILGLFSMFFSFSAWLCLSSFLLITFQSDNKMIYQTDSPFFTVHLLSFFLELLIYLQKKLKSKKLKDNTHLFLWFIYYIMSLYWVDLSL